MEDKHLNKLKRYLGDVIEGRDDLMQCTEQLITNVSFQIQSVSTTRASISQKEALLTYLMKAVVLITELNHSVYKFFEVEPLPNISENIQIQSSPVQDLSDFFKANTNESMSMLDISTSGAKVPNSQALNNSYVRKPLDNTTLKAICLVNSSKLGDNPDNLSREGTTSLAPVAENITTTNISLPDSIAASHAPNYREAGASATSLVQDLRGATALTSPTFSESEVISTVSSSVYQHPLAKFQPPTDIPLQYDTQDLDKIRENLFYLSKKMGFDSDNLTEMHSQFSKNASKAYEYEEPVKERQEREVKKEEIIITKENNSEPSELVNTTNGEIVTSELAAIDSNKKEVLQDNDLKISDGNVMVLNNEIVDAGPSNNTGAIRKQKIFADDLIEFSTSTEDPESCDKVSSWLNNNTLADKKLPSFSDPGTSLDEISVRQNSAIEKLHSIKRHDRNEEVRDQARRDMPDLRLVPVEVPQIIKNDLKKKKRKDLNKETGKYEIKKMEPPEEGAVCVFSHIVSPNEFYLQILDNVTAVLLDEVSDKLHAVFSTTKSMFKTKQEAFDRLGKFCIGSISGEKETWYRLQILDWELGCPSLEVKVKSVDYGFSHRISYKFLREMSKDIADIPMLAIQCHFPLCYPPGSTYANRKTEWPASTIEYLHEITNLYAGSDYSDFKMFQITIAILEGESLAVDMVEYSAPEADSLRSFLLDSGLAIDIVEDYGDHPELGEYFEDLDELEQPENLNELVLGYDARDEMRICTFTRRDGTCYKGKNCKLEHIVLKDGYTTDKTAVFYTALNDAIFPEKGDLVQVLVTAYIDSCTYLVQIVRSPVVKDNVNIKIDRNISDLMDAMNHPKKISKFEHLKVYPAIGEIILGYHSFLKMWMRVVVREVKFDNIGNLMSIEVYAVDFGDQFTVKLKNTRVMLEDFMHVPFQAMQIYLDNYQHRIECDARKARRFFEKHMSYKNFLIHVKSNELPFKVTLTTFEGRDIGLTLVKVGFAEKRSMDVLVAEGHNIDVC